MDVQSTVVLLTALEFLERYALALSNICKEQTRLLLRRAMIEDSSDYIKFNFCKKLRFNLLEKKDICFEL